jgi:hypothetical protein
VNQEHTHRALLEETMKFYIPLVLYCLAFCSSCLVLAQAPTLSLTFENVYLSEVSRNLDPDGYEQTFSTTITDSSGEVTESYTWKRRVLGSESMSEETNLVGGQVFAHSSYLIGGSAYDAGSIGTDPPYCTKLAVDDYEAVELTTTISDVTGFQTATLLDKTSADETVNGFQTDHYRLEPPVENGYYDPASLKGELWFESEASLIVKYSAEATAEDASITRWQYDLVPATDVAALPAACEGL